MNEETASQKLKEFKNALKIRDRFVTDIILASIADALKKNEITKEELMYVLDNWGKTHPKGAKE